MTPLDKFALMQGDLNAALIEREQEIELALVALVAHEHCLFVGPPGTGKSMLSDALVRWMDGAKFQILLTKYTTPEEVFGPISLAGLKADRYRRITTGRLPEAHIAFIDEIWKASSAILNTLLTVLNEREFDNDGTRAPCPLQLCVAASNEWPGSNGDGKELGALFDRFALRRAVRPIATERGLMRLLWGGLNWLLRRAPLTADDPASDKHTEAVPLSSTITPAEINQAAAEAAALPWMDAAKAAFLAILKEARQEGISPGDRRMKKAIGICQAAAWLAGHAQVETDDLEILAAVLWVDPAEQPAKLAKIVGTIANPEGMKINGLLMEAEEIISATDLKDLGQTATACKKLGEVYSQLSGMDGTRAAMAAEHIAGEVKRIRIATVESL